MRDRRVALNDANATVRRTIGTGRKENDHAGEANSREGPQGKARRKSTDDAGRRIRPRGDPQDPPRRTWGAIAATGHCHWPLQSQARGRWLASARERKG